MKEQKIKPLQMNHKDKPIIFWNKEQNLYLLEEFYEEVTSFFNEHENYNEFYLECEIGDDNSSQPVYRMKPYILKFIRNKKFGGYRVEFV